MSAEEAPQHLLCELLYETSPEITAEQIRARLAMALPHSKLVSPADEDDAYLIAHENHQFEFKDGSKMPPLSAITVGNPVDASRLTAALGQTWDWSDARDIVARARHQLIVTEMMARAFDPKIRVDLFFNLLLQVLEIAPPLAIHAHHAQRIVNPANVARSSGASNAFERMSVILNVRLFRIENGQAGDMLMDTRGLAALGLPDLQVHFRNLEPGQMAKLLFDSAYYIYLHGDCIENGHTIQGLQPAQKWKCQHEMALIAPKRFVIDIDPGDPFASGKRNR